MASALVKRASSECQVVCDRSVRHEAERRWHVHIAREVQVRRSASNLSVPLCSSSATAAVLCTLYCSTIQSKHQEDGKRRLGVTDGAGLGV
eukprot:scaffold11462_cov140-Isochrysis_galbana.AAC.8